MMRAHKELRAAEHWPHACTITDIQCMCVCVCVCSNHSVIWEMCVQARAHFTILSPESHYVYILSICKIATEPDDNTRIIDFRHQGELLYKKKQFLKLLETHLLTHHNLMLLLVLLVDFIVAIVVVAYFVQLWSAYSLSSFCLCLSLIIMYWLSFFHPINLLVFLFVTFCLA